MRWKRTLGVGMVFAVAWLSGCGGRERVVIGLPPGLGEDENRRLVEALNLASDAYRTEDPERAMRGYQEAVITYGELPAAWNNLGVLLMDEERYAEAAEAFDTAARLRPTDPRPKYNLGLVFDRRGYLEEAKSHYEEALRRDANFLSALRATVRIDARLNQGSRVTLAHIRKALLLEQDPRWVEWLRMQRIRVEKLVEQVDSTG